MDLRDDDVAQILKIMKQSNFDELHLKMGDLEITVNKHGDLLHHETPASKTTENTVSRTAKNTTIETLNNRPTTSNLVKATEVPETSQNFEEEVVEQGLIPIKSPMLGIFYRAPKPGEPPFVKSGSVVDDDTTVCTIEVMKLFSTIKAGVCGRIKRICVENGTLVQHDQSLFLVDPKSD